MSRVTEWPAIQATTPAMERYARARGWLYERGGVEYISDDDLDRCADEAPPDEDDDVRPAPPAVRVSTPRHPPPPHLAAETAPSGADRNRMYMARTNSAAELQTGDPRWATVQLSKRHRRMIADMGMTEEQFRRQMADGPPDFSSASTASAAGGTRGVREVR